MPSGANGVFQTIAAIARVDQEFVMIAGFLIDCSLSESHQFSAEVTDFPVESGGVVSDNIRNKPLVVTMECIVSNAPLGSLVDLRGDTDLPVDQAYALFKKIRDDRKAVDIVTSLRSYNDMALEDLSIPRAPGGADFLQFTVKFKQVVTVKNKREIRVAPDSSAKQDKNTNATPKPWSGNGFFSVQTRGGTGPAAGAWFDPDINLWRQGGLLNKTTLQWELNNGRPFGIPIAKWQAKPLFDEEIDALRKAHKLGKEAPPDPKTVNIVPGMKHVNVFSR